MKPAGIERDRQIAEIRLIKEGDVLVIQCPHKGEYDSWPCEDCCGDCPSYSTDISAAMELWEEMKGAGFELLLACDLEGIEVEVTHPSLAFNLTGGETEADAISGAWLKWKGAE